MTNYKRMMAVALPLFLVAEIALGFALQKVGGRACVWLSYSSVILACLFCVTTATRSLSYLFTQLALITTVCADYFLVFSEVRQQLPAMIFFSITQMAYFARLYVEDPSAKRRAWNVGVRTVLSAFALLLTWIVLGDGTDAVALISLFYYANLICNIIFAFMQGKKNLLLSIGLLLFVCCDTLIGLGCMDAYFAIEADSVIYRLIHPGFDLAWAFYVPSQTLLAISLLPSRFKKAPVPRA